MLGMLAQSATNSIHFDFFSVVMFAIVGVLFVVLNITVISRLVRPVVRDEKKLETYECGEVPIEDSWVHFDIRFYTIALIFLVFEVEIALLYPWAAVFKELCGDKVSLLGAFVLLEMLFFLLVLFIGLIYVWAKGDLDWVTYALNKQRSKENA